MPSEDRDAGMSEVRSRLDAEPLDTAMRLSQVQEPELVETEEDYYPQKEVMPEGAHYRVIMADFGWEEKDALFIDYFSDYDSANTVFDSLCDDSEFIRYHDKSHVAVQLQKAYRGLSQVFWETIRKSVVYDTVKTMMSR